MKLLVRVLVVMGAQLSNYNKGRREKASAGNCIQGHTRGNSGTRPRDVLQIRAAREQGALRQREGVAVLPSLERAHRPL